jgi:hypothetical protein
MITRASTVLILLAILWMGCKAENPASNLPPGGQFFTVQVGTERFVMYVTDPATIQLGIDNFQGKNSRFPLGRIATGNGGFNSPWSWHFVPESVRLVEASVEVCDGAPGYVNSHLTDYLAVGYCPWGGKIVKVGK